MSGYIYCMSNPDQPGLIKIDQSNTDPRAELSRMGAYGRSRRIDWMVQVDNTNTVHAKITKALSPFAEGDWPGQYRCKAVRARGIAIQFTQAEKRRLKLLDVRPALPAIVLALGLMVQFASIINGKIGPSPALIFAALFWVAYTLPFGSGGRSQLNNGPSDQATS